NTDVSVIIPIYNRERFLEESVNSALNQTYGNIEVILVDDGSTDRSHEICQEWYGALEQVRILRHPENMGQAAAVNDGIKAAKGTYITVLHSDDALLPDAVEQMLEVARRTDADVVHTGVGIRAKGASIPLLSEENDLKLVKLDANLSPQEQVLSPDTGERLKEWLERNTFVDAMYNLFRRSFLIKEDIRFEEAGGNALFSFAWLMKARKIVKTAIPTYVYRVHEESVSDARRDESFVGEIISQMLQAAGHMEKYMHGVSYFTEHPEQGELARITLLSVLDNWWIRRPGYYRNGMNKELNMAVREEMQKHFGRDAWFVSFLFHAWHEQQYGRSLEKDCYYLK
ncbi:MAG: glycosyltransferase, partial [Butyrivibrio sp.]|nr:glycosyltransferase [Butyrivibrio sp.]